MFHYCDIDALNELLNAAQRLIVAAKQAVQDEDESAVYSEVCATQDILCEVKDVIEKGHRRFLKCGRGYCVEATTGKGIPVTVELLGTEAEE